MDARFISQPHSSGEDLRDFLEYVAAESDFDKLAIVVAWAKRSGFRIVEPALTTFRARGGHVQMIVGISEGGATHQGLQLAKDLSDEAHVFHDIRGRTFHPKVYLARGTDRAAALVGSHNLTRGGSVENYEAGVIVALDLGNVEDRGFLDQIDTYITSLLADTACCIPLDAAAIAALVADPSLRVGDEDHRRSAAATTAPSDSDSVTDDLAAGSTSPFSRSSETLRNAPVATSGAAPASTVAPPAPVPPIAGGSTAPPGPASARSPSSGPKPRVVRRWFKILDQANAQRPNPGTNPTGHLSLTQAGHPIAHTQYFRDDFFDSVAWAPGNTRTGAPTEWAEVEFEVVIRGATTGREVLAVEHRPALIAGQGNRASMLHWGDRLLEYFRANNHVGDYVSLEALSDGSYRLVIDASPSGAFIK